MDKQPQSTSHFMTKTTEINPTPTAVFGTTTTCAKEQMWESIPRNNSPPPACKQYRACLSSHDTWDPAQHTQAQLHFPKSALRSKYSSQKLHDRRTTDLKRKEKKNPFLGIHRPLCSDSELDSVLPAPGRPSCPGLCTWCCLALSICQYIL